MKAARLSATLLLSPLLSFAACLSPKGTDLDSTRLRAADLCVSQKPFGIHSRACEHPKSCPLLQAASGVTATARGAVGNPGYRLCRELGGEAHLFRLRLDGRWENHTVCVGQDGGFVDLDRLYRAHAGPTPNR